MSERQMLSEKYPDKDINWSRNKTGPLPEPRLNSDPTTASIDALRQAVVAQTALLRSLSEQIRLGQAATNGALDGLASTAERLEKLERKLTSVDEKATLWAAMNPIHFSGKRQQPKHNQIVAARRKAKR